MKDRLLFLQESLTVVENELKNHFDWKKWELEQERDDLKKQLKLYTFKPKENCNG